MDIGQAARTQVQLWYNDVDISVDVAPGLLSFEYTDFGSDQVDDLQVSIADPDGRWRGEWYPDRGAKLKAAIVWSEGAVQRRLECGTFTIDQPSYSGSPDVITMRALAASTTTSLRREKKTRAWVDITLRSLVGKIASEQGVTIVFDGADTPTMAIVQQKNESDLSMLSRICEREGYAIKVDSNRIVVYQRGKTDHQPSVLTISRTGGRVLPGWQFSTKSVDGYKSCVVRHKHKDKGLIEATYTPPNPPPTGQVLRINTYVGSTAEALRVAQYKLEAANRGLDSAMIPMVGDVQLVSGVPVDLTDFGIFDGKYTIEQAGHRISSGYTTAVNLVKVV